MLDTLREVWHEYGPHAWFGAAGGVLVKAGLLAKLGGLLGWLLTMISGDARFYIALAGMASTLPGQVSWMTQNMAGVIIIGGAGTVLAAKLYTSIKARRNK